MDSALYKGINHPLGNGMIICAKQNVKEFLDFFLDGYGEKQSGVFAHPQCQSGLCEQSTVKMQVERHGA